MDKDIADIHKRLDSLQCSMKETDVALDKLIDILHDLIKRLEQGGTLTRAGWIPPEPTTVN